MHPQELDSWRYRGPDSLIKGGNVGDRAVAQRLRLVIHMREKLCSDLIADDCSIRISVLSFCR